MSYVTKTPKCPYCGHKEPKPKKSTEFVEDGSVLYKECNKCGEMFEVTITISYISRALKPQNLTKTKK